MIELNPENDLGYYFIAQNYTALGEDDNAIKYYTKTLELSPRFQRLPIIWEFNTQKKEMSTPPIDI